MSVGQTKRTIQITKNILKEQYISLSRIKKKTTTQTDIYDSNSNQQKKKNKSNFDQNKEDFKLLRKNLSVRWKAHIQFMCIISRNGSLGCQWELHQRNSLDSVKSVDKGKEQNQWQSWQSLKNYWRSKQFYYSFYNVSIYKALS